MPTDISEKSNRPVRQFITAGNENEQVPDKSFFKTCFIQGLDGEADYNKDGYVTGSELGMYLDTSVVNYSRGYQHPQYGKIRHPKLDKGDFVFVKIGTDKLAFYKRKVERLEQENKLLRQQLKSPQLERLKEESEKKEFEAERQKPEIASFSDENKLKIEPWTGIWDLKYYYGDGYKFILKQNGTKVKSTNDSCCKFSGTIEGSTLNGFIGFYGNERLSCTLIISSDNKSFKGSIRDSGWGPLSSYLWGKRKQ